MTARNTRTTTDTKREAPRSAKTRTARAVEDFVDVEAKFAEAHIEACRAEHPLAGAVVNLITSAVGIYAGVQASAYIGFAALVMTGSAFLGMLIAFIACVVSMIQALRAGAAAGKYISTGQFEHDYQRAKGWVKGLFTKQPEIQNV